VVSKLTPDRIYCSADGSRLVVCSQIAKYGSGASYVYDLGTGKVVSPELYGNWKDPVFFISAGRFLAWGSWIYETRDWTGVGRFDDEGDISMSFATGDQLLKVIKGEGIVKVCEDPLKFRDQVAPPWMAELALSIAGFEWTDAGLRRRSSRNPNVPKFAATDWEAWRRWLLSGE
jgi:hypothetical protein